jgi:hypothetical protein
MYTGGMMFVDHASGHSTSKCKHCAPRPNPLLRNSATCVLCFRLALPSLPTKMTMAFLRPTHSSKNYTATFKPRVTQWRRRSSPEWRCRTQYWDYYVHGSRPGVARRRAHVADSTLWPMAVDYAVHIFDHVPNGVSGITPIELMTCAAPSKGFIHVDPGRSGDLSAI